jgi:hypothetical protein
MNTKHMIITVLGIALTVWSASALACEEHWEPMPEPVVDECNSDSDCGEGSCQLVWVDWSDVPCDGSDFECVEVAKCVSKAPRVSSSTITCFHDGECDGTRVCAMPMCADGACPERAGVCMPVDDVPVTPENGDAILTGCQGDQSPANTLLLAGLLVGLLMRRRWTCRSTS